jgi:hypothetical protein
MISGISLLAKQQKFLFFTLTRQVFCKNELNPLDSLGNMISAVAIVAFTPHLKVAYPIRYLDADYRRFSLSAFICVLLLNLGLSRLIAFKLILM